jgi:AcrR family transcriptional regulator
MPRNSIETRRRIIAAADELFYAEGLRAISVDEIAERAGVTKKTLYYHFRSKDQLIAAYLDARDKPTLQRFQEWAGTTGPVAERVARMFTRLAEAARGDRWLGCGFMRAVAELANLPGHPAVQVAREHKKKFEGWLRASLEDEGRADAAQLAQAIMVLLDGVVAHTLLHRQPGYADAASRTVQIMLAASAQPNRAPALTAVKPARKRAASSRPPLQ